MVSVWSILLFITLLNQSQSVEKPDFLKLRPDKNITVALSGRKPFVILNQNGAPKGMDIIMIQNFARKLNLKTDYFLMNVSLNYIFANESEFNLFSNQTSLRNIDILIGALDENVLTNEHYIASRTYYHDSITWCVQKQKRIPRWKSFFLTCTDPITLVLCPLTLFLCVFTCYFLQQYEDMKPKWDSIKIGIDSLLSLLGLSQEYIPRTLPAKIYVIFGLLGDIIFTTFFVSFTMKSLFNPKFQNQVTSINEIIDGGIPFELVGDRFALEHLKRQHKTYPSEVLEKFIIADDSNLDLYLNQLNENSRLAVAISREHARNIQRNMHHKLYCFEDSEIIHDYALKFIVRKDFPHLNELNAFIRSASAGGLIEKWRLNSVVESNYKQKYEDNTKVIMILEDLLSPFGIVCCLFTFDIFMLFFEFIVHKKKRTTNSSRVWIYVERAIDPDRHFMLETIRFE